ncbi:UNVERIFIED_CONTAM: hypothetical protein RMT77_015582 [Armadillidium vulgare]
MDFKESLKQLKIVYVVMKVGGDVFAEALTLLYAGAKPIEENLLKIAEIKSNGFNSDEKTFLENLKKGKNDIKNMDISMSFKLIQLTCGLESKNSRVWTKKCPKEKENSLEHLLWRFKQERNDIVHQFSNLGHVSDEEFLERIEQNTKHLSTIVEKVGEKAQLSSDEVNSWIKRIKLNIKEFCERFVLTDSPALPEEQSLSIQPLTISKTSERAFEPQSFSPLDPNIPDSEFGISFAMKMTLSTFFYETDVDQGRTKHLDKSNRFYWVERLISTQALYNSEQNSIFWKDYAKYLD